MTPPAGPGTAQADTGAAGATARTGTARAGAAGVDTGGVGTAASARAAAVPRDDGEHPSSSVLRIAALVVAPTTFVTAVLYYFGWSHAYWFLRHFGVNSTVLDLTTQDYLMRSVDGLFVPFAALGLASAALFWAHRLLHPRIGRRTIATGRATGGALFAVGVAAAFGVRIGGVPTYVAALALVAGVLLLSATAVPLPLVAQAALAGLGLFWAAFDYSAAVGSSRAAELVAALPSEPGATVLSAHSLGIRAAGVTEVRCADPEGTYRFRYDGLVLVLRSGQHYVLLPRSWSPGDGVAIVLPRDAGVRLEYRGPDAPRGC